MRCSEFDLRWQQVLDRRQSPDDDPQLRVHLACCEACRARQLGLELVCDVLCNEMPEPDAGLLDNATPWSMCHDDLAERIISELAVTSPSTPRRFAASRSRGWAVRAAAIGVAAATLMAMYVSGGTPPAAQPLAVAATPPAASSIVVHESAATAGTLAASAALPPIHQPRRVTDADVQFLERLAARGDRVAARISAVAEGIDDVMLGTGQELATVVHRIPDVAIELASDGRADLVAAREPWVAAAHGLRPVAASMTETWHILRRALPSGEPRRGGNG